MTQHEEKEFIIAWSAADEFVVNAYKQKQRWKRTNDSWELYCFFVAMRAVFENACVLNKFTEQDRELGKVISIYKKGYEKLGLRNFCNNGIHRNKVHESNLPILVIGGFNASKNEFTFLENKVNINDAFSLIQSFRKDVRSILTKRLRDSYSKENIQIEGIIPFSLLHGFAEKRSSRKYRHPSN